MIVGKLNRKEVRLYQEYLQRIDLTGLTGENPVLTFVALVLILLAVLLMVGLYGVQNFTVRIYNWNGKRYCYLGRAGLHRRSDGYYVRIGERTADLSYTTLYQICPSKGFVRRNRYGNMTLCAGDEKCMMHIDRCMRQSVYYRKALS